MNLDTLIGKLNALKVKFGGDLEVCMYVGGDSQPHLTIDGVEVREYETVLGERRSRVVLL